MNIKASLSSILLLIVVLLSLFLRVYRLHDTPVSMYWDEVALGYNAYSIAETARDEYGKLLPVLFQSFDDYKFPGYVYVAAPFVKVLGLNVVSVRLPSAVMGTLSVLVLYLVVVNLLGRDKSLSLTVPKTAFQVKLSSVQIGTFIIRPNELLGLLSAFLLAISSWHLQFSRAAFEANGSLFFALLASLMFLYGLNDKRYLYLSSILFGLSMYFYRGAFVFVPLFIMFLCIIYFKRLTLKSIVIFGLLLTLILLPLFIAMSSPEAQNRSNQVFIGNQKDDYLYESALKIREADNSLWARVVYNRRLWLVHGFLENYSKHFSYEYLLESGDPNLRHGVSEMGVIYKWELAFVVLGIFALLALKSKKPALFVLCWLLAAPVAASLSYPTPHALRSIYMVPMFMVLVAFGIVSFTALMPKYAKYLVIAAILIVGMNYFGLYMQNYYGQYRTLSAEQWADGHFQLNEYVENNKQDYDQVVISGHYWKPYIYTLFYTQYSPKIFQESGSWQGFDIYRFGGTSWGENEVELDQIDITELAGEQKTLFALAQNEYDAHREILSQIDTIEDSRGQTVYILSEIIR